LFISKHSKMTEFLKRGNPGLASIKDLPILQVKRMQSWKDYVPCLATDQLCHLLLHQDAPPPGGYPSIRVERRLPSTGPTGVAIFGIVGAIMGYGFYQLWQQKTDKKWVVLVGAGRHWLCSSKY
jgi:NADH dehydrogenase (ubiquinone) 1 alpha subcomplex subunit 13